MNPLPLSRASALAVLAALAASPPCPAQLLSNWPAALPSGPFAGTAAGDFTGDQRLSAYVVAGSNLFFAFEPANYQALSQAPVSNVVSIVAMLPAAGSTRERLLATTTTGASLITLNADTTYTITSPLTAAWAGARGLVKRRHNNGSGYAVAAISASGTNILTAFGLSGGDPLHLASIPVGANLDAVTLVDWDQDGMMEVVGITQGNVVPFEIDGTVRPIRTFGGTNAVVNVLLAEPSGERLAIVGNLGSTSYVWTLDRTVTNAGVAIPTHNLDVSGPLQAIGLAAYDWDGDGDTDLLLSHAQSTKTLLLTNSRANPTAPPFSAGALTALPAAAPGASTACAPAWRDFSHNGFTEMWWPITSSNQIAFGNLGPVLPQVPPSVWLGDCLIESASAPVAGAVNLGVSLLPDSELFPAEDQYEVVVWHQSNPFTMPVPPVDPVAVYSGNGTFGSLPVVNNTLRLQITVNLDTTGFTANHHYYVEIRRFAAASGEAYPSIFAGFTLFMPDLTTQQIAQNVSYLLSLPGGQDPLRKVETNNPSRPEHIGGIITRSFPPPFGPTAPPKTTT